MLLPWPVLLSWPLLLLGLMRCRSWLTLCCGEGSGGGEGGRSTGRRRGRVRWLPWTGTCVCRVAVDVGRWLSGAGARRHARTKKKEDDEMELPFVVPGSAHGHLGDGPRAAGHQRAMLPHAGTAKGVRPGVAGPRRTYLLLSARLAGSPTKQMATRGVASVTSTSRKVRPARPFQTERERALYKAAGFFAMHERRSLQKSAFPASSAERRCGRAPPMGSPATLRTLFRGHERGGGPSVCRRPRRRAPTPGAQIMM